MSEVAGRSLKGQRHPTSVGPSALAMGFRSARVQADSKDQVLHIGCTNHTLNGTWGPESSNIGYLDSMGWLISQALLVS